MLKSKPTGRIIFVITNSFPFGIGETFFEKEIEYLSKKFSKVVIVCNDIDSKNHRILPDNADVYRVGYSLSSFQKIMSVTV